MSLGRFFFSGSSSWVTGESYQELEDRLTSGLETFTDGAPFTIQRFCEVLLNPRDRYPNLDKVALAFEKLLLVTSTIPPSPGPYPSVPSVADQQPAKRDTVDSGADIIISEAKDVPIAVDAHMVDSESTEPKEGSMDVEETAEETITAETTAEQGSRENASEVKESLGWQWSHLLTLIASPPATLDCILKTA